MAALLAACSGLRSTSPDTLPIGELHIEQLTASTWTATPRPDQHPGTQPDAALVKAIEKASHCQVTDSNVDPQSHVLYAQVDCGSRFND